MLSGWFLGHDTGVTKLDAVTEIYAVLSYGWFLRLIKPDVQMVLFGLGLTGTHALSNAHLPTFARDAVYAKRFQAKIILSGSKKLDSTVCILPHHSLHGVTTQQTTSCS